MGLPVVYDCMISWSYSFFYQTHMTVRTQLALTFTFVGIALQSFNCFVCRKC